MDLLPYDPDENSSFPAKEYLKRFVDPMDDPMKVHHKFLAAYHQFYSTYGSKFSGSESLLEFGGGPAIHSLISASKYVGSIVFSDYAATNRQEITSWRDKEVGYHDWSPYFTYVLSHLEGDNTESVLETREEELRKKIKDVVSCDLKSENMVDALQYAPFDVIQTNLCFEAVCQTIEEYGNCLYKLSELLNPKGFLLCLTSLGGDWYTCAGSGTKLYMLNLEEDNVKQAFQQPGLSLVESYNIQPLRNPISSTKSFQFSIAQKMA